jgi:ABC-type dipeptide/oligopeptide/nickel transport system ATPase component
MDTLSFLDGLGQDVWASLEAFRGSPGAVKSQLLLLRTYLTYLVQQGVISDGWPSPLSEHLLGVFQQVPLESRSLPQFAYLPLVATMARTHEKLNKLASQDDDHAEDIVYLLLCKKLVVLPNSGIVEEIELPHSLQLALQFHSSPATKSFLSTKKQSPNATIKPQLASTIVKMSSVQDSPSTDHPSMLLGSMYQDKSDHNLSFLSTIWQGPYNGNNAAAVYIQFLQNPTLLASELSNLKIHMAHVVSAGLLFGFSPSPMWSRLIQIYNAHNSEIPLRPIVRRLPIVSQQAKFYEELKEFSVNFSDASPICLSYLKSFALQPQGFFDSSTLPALPYIPDSTLEQNDILIASMLTTLATSLSSTQIGWGHTNSLTLAASISPSLQLENPSMTKYQVSTVVAPSTSTPSAGSQQTGTHNPRNPFALPPESPTSRYLLYTQNDVSASTQPLSYPSYAASSTNLTSPVASSSLAPSAMAVKPASASASTQATTSSTSAMDLIPRTPIYPPKNDRRSVLVVGESGKGKSSLCRYIAECNADSNADVEIARNLFKEDAGVRGFTCRTTSSSINTIHGQCRVFDTPGLNDSDNRDDEFIADIVKSLRHVDDCGAVMLVLKSTDTRVNKTIQFILKIFHGILGNALVSMLIIVFTHGSPHVRKEWKKKNPNFTQQYRDMLIEMVFGATNVTNVVPLFVIDTSPDAETEGEMEMNANVAKTILTMAFSHAPHNCGSATIVRTPDAELKHAKAQLEKAAQEAKAKFETDLKAEKEKADKQCLEMEERMAQMRAEMQRQVLVRIQEHQERGGDAFGEVSGVVWVPPTGKKYHSSNSCAGHNGDRVTTTEAMRRGYDPCKKCMSFMF